MHFREPPAPSSLRANLCRALPVIVLVLLIAAPVALGAFAKGGVYATAKYRIAFLVNSKGTALRNANWACTHRDLSNGTQTVFQFFGSGEGEVHGAGAIGHHGAFAYSGPALTNGGAKVHLGISGRFVNKSKAVGVIRSPRCAHGKLVHFTALYRGN
jgi:hypothetical protein